MAEQLKFFKGNEANLPTTLETGAIYHCLDTGNTYLATSTSAKVLFATNADIPDVTTSDDGKFLRVVNGVWSAQNVPNAEEASF